MSIVLVAAAAAFSQSSEITYQGKLDDNGVPANGTYQMQFKLFKTGNTQVGPTITNAAVTVTNGTFSVPLDFTEAAYDGSDRFLEIAVKRNAGDPFTTLAPRIKTSNVPYALRSKFSQSANSATNSANSDALGNIPFNRYVVTDLNGDVAIGATPAGSKLTVGGRIETTSGGIKFPDATTQTTAGLVSVTAASPLTGNGTPGSPLGITSPLGVRDRDNPAQQPIYIKTSLNNQTIYTVPAGKRFVIEFISGEASASASAPLPKMQVVLFGPAAQPTYLIPPETWIDTQFGRTWLYSKLVRIYASSGTQLALIVDGVPSPSINLYVSGYLVDLP
jgi:hypothetical protein